MEIIIDNLGMFDYEGVVRVYGYSDRNRPARVDYIGDDRKQPEWQRRRNQSRRAKTQMKGDF